MTISLSRARSPVMELAALGAIEGDIGAWGNFGGFHKKLFTWTENVQHSRREWVALLKQIDASRMLRPAAVPKYWVVETGPQTTIVGEGSDNPCAFCLASDRCQVTMQTDRCILRIGPVAGLQEIINVPIGQIGRAVQNSELSRSGKV